MPEVDPLNLPVPSAAPTYDAAEAGTSPLPAFAMLSHPGSVRHSNEDACGAHPALGVFVVCDGMGGAAAGEIASQLAIETFLDTLQYPAAFSVAQKRLPSDRTQLGENSASPTRLEQAVREANDVVFRTAQRSHTLRGMGTTLVAILLEDAASPARALWLAHVGDSRCYRLRGGVLHLLTQDHSLVEEQIQAGVLSRADAALSPIRNIITRAIGSQAVVEPSIASHAIHPGDLYLLATDGLNRELDDAAIAQILTRATGSSAGASSLEAACQALVNAAIHNGGGDNITVLLLACA